MKFESRKSAVIPILIGLMLILGAIGSRDQLYVSLIILLPITLYLAWMWFDTYYIIDGDRLFYKSALFKGIIDIQTINEIDKNRTLYAGHKPSLSGKGVIIKYNKWDDIYLSPVQTDEFVEALKSINPQIRIVQ